MQESKPTENMQRFINLNKKVKIVEGERVTKKGRPATNRYELDSAVIKYTFTNGASIVLTREDLLSNLSYKPIWDL